MSDEHDELIEALQEQTASLNSFTTAVMELIQALADMVAVGAEDDSVPSLYLDGTEIDG